MWLGLIKTTEEDCGLGTNVAQIFRLLLRDRDSSLSLCTSYRPRDHCIHSRCWRSLNVYGSLSKHSSRCGLSYPPHNPMEKREAFQFCFSLGKLSLGISILQVLQLSSWKFSFLPMLFWLLLLFWVGHRAWSLPLKVCLGSKLFCMFIREVKPRLHWCWASTLMLRFTPGFLAVAYLSMPVPISSLHTEW